MSFMKCLKGKMADGLLTEKEFESLQKQYSRLNKAYARFMGDTDAASKAAAKFVEVRAERMNKLKVNTIRSIEAQESVWKEILDKAARSKNLIFNSEGNKAGWAYSDFLEGVDLKASVIAESYMRELGQLIDTFRLDWTGFRRRNGLEGMELVVREILGEATGDADAAKMASALNQVFESVHHRHSAAGGIMGKLDKFFPQIHVRDAFRKIGGKAGEFISFEEWKGFVFPKLDRSKMLDIETGLPLSDKKLNSYLKEMFDDVTTNGMASRRKARDKGEPILHRGTDVYGKRDAKRFLKFLTPDDAMEYNAKYGVGREGLYDSMTQYIHSVSRDIAMMEKMGPRPNATARDIGLRLEEVGAGKNIRKFTAGSYDEMSGRNGSSSDPDNPGWYMAAGSVLNNIRASTLGSAPISAISDPTFIAITARMNGLPVAKVMKDYLKMLNPASAADRRLADQLGFIIENASGKSFADGRLAGEIMGGKKSRFMAQSVNRLSGLHVMTKAGGDSVSMNLMLGLANESKKSFSDLHPKFRDGMEKHGISSADWDLIRQTEQYQVAGRDVAFIRPREISMDRNIPAAKAQELADKVDSWSKSMRLSATNEPSLFTRSLTSGGGFGFEHGTVPRLIATSLTMFKTFPISVIVNHLIPALSQAAYGKGIGRFEHAASIALGTTVLGTLAVQLRQIALGKTPRDWEDWKLWRAGALQGGGMGLFGDFLFADYSRYGRSPVTEAFGPVVGLGRDVAATLFGDIDRIAEGKESKFLPNLFKLLKRNTPLSTLWYGRLALERGITDHVEAMADQDYYSKQRRKETNMYKEYGQQYWWRPGQFLPK
jgi:hypothetical protein